MKKTKSNSVLLKNTDSVKAPNINSARRPSSLQNNQTSRLDKSLITLSQTKSNNTLQPNYTSKIIPSIPMRNIQKLKIKPRENDENYLSSTLKTYILKSSREFNMILKEIPKFSARKIQDLKKGYKFTEDYDGLASSFLTIFTELDPELKKEAVSLRIKVGENLVGYFSNSGKFISILRNLSETLKKKEISNRALNDSLKIFETVKRSKLSTNYQDLYDFMQLILGYFRGRKSSIRVLGDHNNPLFSSTCKTPEKLKSTQFIVESTAESSFLYYSKPMTCSNKSTSQISLFKKPNAQSRKNNESLRSASHSSLTKRANRLNDSKTSENENFSKEIHFSERKKEWDEIRKHKRCVESERFQEMIKELNTKRAENLKFEKLVQEQRKKEKLELKQFKEEEFQESKRLKRLKNLREKKEIEDEINRNLQKSFTGK